MKKSPRAPIILYHRQQKSSFNYWQWQIEEQSSGKIRTKHTHLAIKRSLCMSDKDPMRRAGVIKGFFFFFLKDERNREIPSRGGRNRK